MTKGTGSGPFFWRFFDRNASNSVRLEIAGIVIPNAEAIEGPLAAVGWVTDAAGISLQTTVKVNFVHAYVTKEFFNWWTKISSGRVDGRSVSIICSDSNGAEFMRTNAYNCSAEKWDFVGANPNALMEKIGLLCQNVEVKSNP
jgi:hypothetical protein